MSTVKSLYIKAINCPSQQIKIENTSLAEIAPAPSEPGDKLSIDEEAVSLLQMNRQKIINEIQNQFKGRVFLTTVSQIFIIKNMM